MTLLYFLIIIAVILGLNSIPEMTLRTFPKIENVILKILSISTILFITFTLLEFNGYRLKGYYSYTTITLIFLFSVFIYFILFKNTRKKIITILPLTLMIFFAILMLSFGRIIYEVPIDKTDKISVSSGGFMTCGEIYHITQTKYLIFDKEILHINNLCLMGTYKIEIIKLDSKYVDFLIYHNGKSGSENPYKLNIKR